MAKPFAGIRVVDLTHVLAGPFCAWQFGLLGADVVKIENPADPDCARGRGPDDALNAAGRGLNYQVQGTNKRAVAIDIQRPEGRDLVLELTRGADVVIENFRTGALAARGLGYEHVAAVNPGIVYCSISGYGDSGPRAGINAYDNVIQAASGVIDQSGGHKPGLSFVDYAAGYNAAFAISAALLRREREGVGAHISCSMFETALMLMAPELAAKQHSPDVKRAKEAGIASYESADGAVIMLGAFTPRQNAGLWRLLAREGFDAADFADTPDWPSLWAKSADMRARLAEIMRTRTADSWQTLMQANGLPAERVRALAEAAVDPQLEARQFYHGGGNDEPILPVAAYRFSDDGPSIERPAPRVGEHTDEILSELGLDAETIASLRARGVVA